MSRPERFFAGVLVVALLGAGWAYYRAQARQTATLARISALENRLIISNGQRGRAASQTVFSLSATVSKNHNMHADVAVLQQARKIQARTKTLLDTLKQLRQSWQVAGHSTGLRQLPNQLRQYVSFIKAFVPDTPLLNHASPQPESVGWLGEFDIAREPKPAALALLTKLETQVRQVEAEALMNQARKVGAGCCFCVDRIGAFAISASETVASGAIYQAQLLLLLGTSASRAQFSANGHELQIAPDLRHASVRFKVPAARPGQPDTVRAKWHGRVQMPWAAGDTVLQTTVPYFIAKPRQR